MSTALHNAACSQLAWVYGPRIDPLAPPINLAWVREASKLLIPFPDWILTDWENAAEILAQPRQETTRAWTWDPTLPEDIVYLVVVKVCAILHSIPRPRPVQR